MTQEELLELISEVQQYQSELGDIEVKTANKGTPQSHLASADRRTNEI